jgi:hypothetical protein
VTHFDGLVLAHGAFDHSMNYRSVLLFGTGVWLRDPTTKLEALRAISEHVLPGRWDDVRPPTEAELKRTHVLGVPVVEASGKVRTGPPTSDALPWDTWTGVVPAQLTWGFPVAWNATADVPQYIARLGGTDATTRAPGRAPRARRPHGHRFAR